MSGRGLLSLAVLGLAAAASAQPQRAHAAFDAASQPVPGLSTPVQEGDEIERLIGAAREIAQRSGPRAAYDFLEDHESLANEPDIVFEKSIYAIDARSYGLAEDLLRKYIRARPESANGYNALGYMLADNNSKLSEAQELIEKALSLSPNSPAIIDSHGWVLYRMGKLSQALARIEEAVARSGDRQSPEMLAHLGELLWESGREELAVDVWRTGWAIDSKHEYLTATIERYAKDRTY